MDGLSVGKDGGLLIVRSRYEDRAVVKSIGARWDKGNRYWTLPFTVESVQAVTSNLDYMTPGAEIERLLREQQAKEEKLARIKLLSTRDTPICLKVPGVRLSLYNYQKLGVLFAVTNGDGVLIADSMGLGKSIEAIGAACYMKSRGECEHCLVVTPASLKWNWPIEIEKFTNEKYVVIDGTPDDRVGQWLDQEPFFYIVNFALVLEDLFGGREFKIKEDDDELAIDRKMRQMEKAQERAELLAPVRGRTWPAVIIDEIHYLKNSSAKRTQNIRKLDARFRMGLSGTPLDGKLEDLHSVMEFIKPGLLGTKTSFLQRHADFDFWGKVTGYRNIGEVRRKIEPFFIRRLKKDVLTELPDKVYENRYVVLSPQEKKIYKQLASRGHEITEDEEAVVAVIRCKQFCDYPGLIDIDTRRCSKLEAWLEIIDELVVENGEQVLVFSQYATMNEALIDELDGLGVKYRYICGDTPNRERVEIQNEFVSDSSIKVLVGTDAMSLGLNLVAAVYVINYDDAWSPSVMEQREDRCHRIGQKHQVTVVNFIVKDTIEERIRSVLYDKARVSADALGDETEEMVLRRMGPKDIARLL